MISDGAARPVAINSFCLFMKAPFRQYESTRLLSINVSLRLLRLNVKNLVI